MYQQKFMPYNQMNDVYEEDQFEQEDSQPLIQQVDPNYQPNDREVKQYALDVLGMSLPEDDRLLYLAKQGLKAPLPANWQPFQGRDGQVYYKHKITQEKTYEHPTDVQYRKKYVQQKQRMARKNLKSMSLKNNPLSLFGQPLGSNPSILGPKSGINPLGLSNLSSQSHQTISKQVSKLDPKLQEQLQNQLQELEFKLKRQLKQFESDRQTQHQKNMKKYKTDFENSLNELKTNKFSSASLESSIKQQKQRIKQRLREAYQDRFKDEFVDVEKEEQKKYQQFVQLYEEDNKIKLKKYQQQKEKQYNERIRKIQNEQIRHEQMKSRKASERQKILSDIKLSYQQQGNQEIEQATKYTFENQLNKIKSGYADKIKQFEEKLENQFLEMKKLLGHDPNQIIQQMAEKRNRLKKMAQQKLESLKKKQYQKVSLQSEQKLQKAIKEAQSSLESLHNKQLQSHKTLSLSKLQSMRLQLQNQYKQNLNRKIQQTYSQIKKSTTQYQKDKNKKILQLRQQHIQQILATTNQKTQQISIKMSIKDKQQMIENKQQLIQSLRKQVDLQKLVLKDLIMCKNLCLSKNLDEELKRLMTQHNVKYKPEIFIKHQKRYNELKAKYKSDKQLLASMIGQLQSSSYMGFYDRNSRQQDSNHQSTSSTSLLVKQYNKDVRSMRQNQQMLNKYELVLRKAELADQSALKQLQQQNFDYKQIQLRSNLAGFSNHINDGPRLNQIQNAEQVFRQKNKYYEAGSSNSYKSVQDSLKQHSKFLNNVKAELNRKLYKVRSNNFYRV